MPRWRLRLLLTTGVLVAFLSFILVRGDRNAPQPPPVAAPDAAPSGADSGRRTATIRPTAPAPRVAQPRDVYFPVQTGARWVYDEDGREFTQVVTAVTTDGDAKVVSVGLIEADGKVTPLEKVKVSSRGLIRLEERGVRCAPPLHLLRLPVQIATSDADDLPLDFLAPFGPAALVRTEEIRVPAGVYQAVRGWTSGWTEEPAPRPSSPGLLTPLTETCWYAPKVGLVKRTLAPEGRSENVSEFVLKAFFSGKE